MIVEAPERIGLAIPHVFAALGGQHRAVGGVDQADIDPLVGLLDDQASRLSGRNPPNPAFAIADGPHRCELIGLDLREGRAVERPQHAGFPVCQIDPVLQIVNRQIGNAGPAADRGIDLVRGRVYAQQERGQRGGNVNLGNQIDIRQIEVRIRHHEISGIDPQGHRHHHRRTGTRHGHGSLIDSRRKTTCIHRNRQSARRGAGRRDGLDPSSALGRSPCLRHGGFKLNRFQVSGYTLDRLRGNGGPRECHAGNAERINQAATHRGSIAPDRNDAPKISLADGQSSAQRHFVAVGQAQIEWR